MTWLLKYGSPTLVGIFKKTYNSGLCSNINTDNVNIYPPTDDRNNYPLVNLTNVVSTKRSLRALPLPGHCEISSIYQSHIWQLADSSNFLARTMLRRTHRTANSRSVTFLRAPRYAIFIPTHVRRREIVPLVPVSYKINFEFQRNWNVASWSLFENSKISNFFMTKSIYRPNIFLWQRLLRLEARDKFCNHFVNFVNWQWTECGTIVQGECFGTYTCALLGKIQRQD